MNFLAHSYLSFHQPEILIGNMISDFVKGRKKFDYPEAIQKGIQLHRDIDTFTDDHPTTKEAKQFFKPAVGLYAGAFIDVVYDHFLATDQQQFLEMKLNDHCQNTYEVLHENTMLLPTKFQMMLPYMMSQNWLFNYQHLWGIENSFGGVARRATYLNSSSEVFGLFKHNYNELQKCYNAFFPQVKAFAFTELQRLLNQ
jgi:acyl carrier protein phosphodiesterase